MAISKVIYGGETLIDLTNDSVTADKLLSGVTAHGKDGEIIIGTCEFDSDTSDANATASEILKPKTAYVNGVKITGTMINRGAQNGSIKSKSSSYTIQQGYHDGSGKIGIDADEQAKLIPANIREGITILGVVGSMTGAEAEKKQTKTVTPTVDGFTVLPDSGYTCLAQVTVEPIPYTESTNSAGGTTVTIAGA